MVCIFPRTKLVDNLSYGLWGVMCFQRYGLREVRLYLCNLSDNSLCHVECKRTWICQCEDWVWCIVTWCLIQAQIMLRTSQFGSLDWTGNCWVLPGHSRTIFVVHWFYALSYRVLQNNDGQLLSPSESFKFKSWELFIHLQCPHPCHPSITIQVELTSMVLAVSQLYSMSY